MAKTNPFVFLKAINVTKEDLMSNDSEFVEEQYVPFITNRALSYFHDTLFLANYMNIRHGQDHKGQFLFYLHGVPKGKRFRKWVKREDNDLVELIQEIYKYNRVDAVEALEILTDKDIEQLKDMMYEGGVNNHAGTTNI